MAYYYVYKEQKTNENKSFAFVHQLDFKKKKIVRELMQNKTDIETKQKMKVQKKISRIFDHKKTEQDLKHQINILRKIIESTTWIEKNRLTQSILYEISKFVFRNPICFMTPIYKHLESKNLNLSQKKSYIAINSYLPKNKFIRSEATTFQTDVQQIGQLSSLKQGKSSVNDFNLQAQQFQKYAQGQYAINIKIQKYWKSCKIKDGITNLKQIITKAKHLIQFFKNIKIDNPKTQEEIPQFQANINLEQKQSKVYTLICQNYDYIYSKIQQIQQNQKLKKLDHSIAKTYVQMMNKNMVIFTVQKNNFNPISYRSQGKYLYFENSMELQILSQKFNRIYGNLESFKVQEKMLKLVPHLECKEDGSWTLQNSHNISLELFQECEKRIDRKKGFMVDRFLNFFYYDDFQIQQI